MTGEGFILREIQGIPYYSCLAFEDLPHLRHGFSTRRGGVPDLKESSLNLSETFWDSPARVNENRRRLLSALHLADAPLITLHQVHSNRVHIIEDISTQWNRAEGDAIATRAENIALAVKTADCLPVLIADPVKNAVAAVHSGWRGTLSQVLLCTIREMQRVFGSDPSQLLTAIGPGIRACCYEVGREVADLFKIEYPECCSAMSASVRPDKYLLDLGKVLDIQMNLAGIRPENRHDLGACTCCNTREFFSHRAEGSAAGRMMSIIGLLPGRAKAQSGKGTKD
jgi:YfiH family protein